MGLSAEAQFHVLAVDDSVIDRKLIERLLKTSSYQGIICSWSFWFLLEKKKKMVLFNSAFESLFWL